MNKNEKKIKDIGVQSKKYIGSNINEIFIIENWLPSIWPQEQDILESSDNALCIT